MLTPLKKREIWEAIKESKFPIIMGVQAMTDFSINVACVTDTVWINVFQTAVRAKMMQEGLDRGISEVRN